MALTKERILILGASLMQRPAILAARGLGLETVAVDANPAAEAAALADRFFPLDLKDKEGILDLGRRLYARGGLAAVFTAGTDFSATVAYVAEALGLPGNGYETALNTTDKSRMRACFERAGVPSPRHIRLEGGAAGRAGAAAPPFGFPAVVKPVDNMGARGCRAVFSRAELGEAARAALALSRSGAVIVEEFMEGPEFSVDSIACGGRLFICGLADRHVRFPPYFVETGHTMPAALDGARAARLLAVFEAGVRALGIRSGCAKGDVKYTPRGPMIGEIASRLSGGYMSGWTYPYASGVDLTRAAILVALGRDPARVEEALRVTRSCVSAERAVISIPGTAREVSGADDARRLPYIKDVFLRTAAGGRVDFPRDNVSKCANVISAAPDRETAVEAAEAAVRAVLIPLVCPDGRTDAFLARACAEGGADGFPPPAFGLDADLARLLEALPPSRRAPGDANILCVIDFPALAASGLRDWAGRPVSEALDAARRVCGLPLPLRAAPDGPFLGREFWRAFVRGTYQAAAYVAALPPRF